MKTVILVTSLLALSTIASAAAVDCTASAPTGAIGANVMSLTMGCFGGGLLFDTFAVNSTPQGTNVFVSALGTGPVGNPLGFSLGFQILTPPAPVDTILQYRVATLNGAATITGVDIGQNGINTTIGETVCDQAFVNGICATGHVLANFSNPPTPNTAVILLTGGARSQIYIAKDIAEPTGTSFISSFVSNQETGTVPEPSTSVLLSFGLLGMAGLARKFRTN